MEISVEQVMKLAELAKIEMDYDTASTFHADLSEILQYFGNLDELDTSHIPPTSCVFEGFAALRDDVVQKSLSYEDISLCANEHFDVLRGVFILQGVFDLIER